MMENVRGIGGVFLHSDTPEKLANWYADNFGFDLQEWGETWGLSFDVRDAERPDETVQCVWSIMPADDQPPSSGGVTINYRVADIVEMRRQLEENGVEVSDIVDDPFGKFAWAHDPDGNRIELWQPSEQSPAE